MPPKKISEHIVILCFKRRYPKQNSVICLKSTILVPPNILAPPKFLGWLRYCHQHAVISTLPLTLSLNLVSSILTLLAILVLFTVFFSDSW